MFPTRIWQILDTQHTRNKKNWITSQIRANKISWNHSSLILHTLHMALHKKRSNGGTPLRSVPPVPPVYPPPRTKAPSPWTAPGHLPLFFSPTIGDRHLQFMVFYGIFHWKDDVINLWDLGSTHSQTNPHGSSDIFRSCWTIAWCCLRHILENDRKMKAKNCWNL